MSSSESQPNFIVQEQDPSLQDFIKRVQKKKPVKKTQIPLGDRPVDTKNLVENPSDEFTTQFGSILIAALILVIALAWKDFFNQVAHQIFPNDNIVGMFIYAVVVTIILALIVYLVARQTTK